MNSHADSCMSDIAAPVVRQFEAYNRHDLEAFLACFSDDFRSWRIPAETPSVQGKPALAAFYAEHRFNNPKLKAELTVGPGPAKAASRPEAKGQTVAAKADAKPHK